MLYLDGVSQNVGPYNATFVFNGPSAIGARGGDLGASFLGSIDELAIYNRALSSAEILAIYQADGGKCPTGAPPSINTQPQSQVVNAGGTVSFSVAAAGTLPLNYQWRFNGTNIGGATGTSVVLSNVQPSQAGNYSVRVTNLFGSVISTNALLTVQPAPTNCAPPAPGLVSWWRGEGNALDQTDGNNGTLNGNTTFGAGRVGQAFVFDGAGDGVSVGNPTNLQLQNFTIEAWVKRAHPTLASFGGENSGSIFSDTTGGYALAIHDNGILFIGKVFVSAVDSTLAIVGTNAFHHVAVTKSGTNVVLYLNGTGQAVGPYDPGFVFNGPAAIGARGGDFGASFLGSIDEVSIYNRALTEAEIQAIANAGGGGKCITTGAPPSIVTQPQTQVVSAGGTANFTVAAAGALPLNYQWRFNGTNLGGATGTSLMLSNVQPSQAGNYSVRVTNLFGSVISSNALLTVEPVSTNCAPPAPGLVSWWRGEGNSFDQVDGNNGTLNGNTTFGAGRVGQAFVFDGSGDGVSIGNPTNLRLQNFTIEAWVKRSHPTLVSLGGEGSGVIFSWSGGGYGLGMRDNGRPYLTKVWVSDVSSTLAVVGTNAFHHVAVTKSGTNVVIYVNGTGQAVGPYDPGFVFDGPAVIGARGTDFGTSFLGSIDEVSIYNRALTSAEIQAIVNAGGAGKCITTGAPPSIITQPQSQVVNAGSIVNFSVAAAGALPLNYQWRFNGTNLGGATGTTLVLSNVQPSQAGNYSVRVTNLFGSVISSNALLTVEPVPTNCAPPAPGLISWWKGEGNASDLVDGNNGTLHGNTTFGAGRVGQAFVFDGASDGVSIGNPTNLRLQNFTIETWVRRSHPTLASLAGDGSGAIFSWSGGGYGLGIRDNGRPYLTKVWISDVSSTLAVVGTNAFHHVAVTKSGTNVVIYVNGTGQAVGPYDPGFVFEGPAAIGARGGDLGSSFLGSVDELSVYGRALSADEIQAIYQAGGAGKCQQAIPPAISTHPMNRTVTVGGATTFTVQASGTQPLSYQWRFNGTNILGATAASLSLTNIQLAQAGTYSVVVSNLAGFVISSNATLTVNFGPALVRVLGTNTSAGAEVTVPIVLVGNGNENALGFSLSFNPTLLTFAGVSLGTGAQDATLLVNNSQVSTGRLGIALALPTGATFAAGTQQVVLVTFTAGVVSSSSSAMVNFAEAPIARQLSDPLGNPLPATYSGGIVSISAADFEGDVAPRPQGDRNVTIIDWVLAGRFAAGLESTTNASEFQRVDTAPRNTLGNGAITVTDWVQVGRYAARLDPLTVVGGPTGPSGGKGSSDFGQNDLSNRRLRVIDAVISQAHSGKVSVKLEAQGDENAIGFSVAFDPAAFTYTGATLGGGAVGATLNVNASQAASGKLGFVVGLGVGSTFAAGTRELVTINLQAKAASGDYVVSLIDVPVARQVADAGALDLVAGYENGTISISPVPSLRIRQNGQHITVSWPLWATNFVLQESDNAANSNWSAVAGTPADTETERVLILPMGAGAKFYRLHRP